MARFVMTDSHCNHPNHSTVRLTTKSRKTTERQHVEVTKMSDEISKPVPKKRMSKGLRIRIGGTKKTRRFSRSWLVQDLLGIGLDFNPAREIAEAVLIKLQGLRKKVLDTGELQSIVVSHLEDVNHEFVERYDLHQNASQKISPVAVLLCGVSGIGKSTLAKNLSQRMNVQNLIGTDMIREIMRGTISKTLMPELHCSSYEAHKHLLTTASPILNKTVLGYEQQARQVIVGIESAIQSTLQINVTSIFEGVHLGPSILGQRLLGNPRIIPFVLTLEDTELHKTRFLKRSETQGRRKSQKYIRYFSEIKRIDKYLIETAEEFEVPVIDTTDANIAISEIIDIVWARKRKLSAR